MLTIKINTLHTQNIYEKLTVFIGCQILQVVVFIHWISRSTTENSSRKYWVFLICTLYVQIVAFNNNKKW